MSSVETMRYPSLDRFSRTVSISPDALVEAFELERDFHTRILAESDPGKRARLYEEIYGLVHPIYERGLTAPPPPPDWNPKRHLISLFAEELRDRDVLDVGCGQGHFLRGLRAAGHRGRLVGLDVTPPREPIDGVEFRRSSVVSFLLDERFDVVMSDNVYEHVAPADAAVHLRSIRDSLRPGGLAIILTPSRLFGPWDVTRIVDDSYRGRVPAQGTHLNETTYRELCGCLKTCGFVRCRSVIPLARIRPTLQTVRFPAALLGWLELVPGLVAAVRVWSRKLHLPALEVTVIARRPAP